MSFEQATYSFAGGHPPTPTRTPTSDACDEQHAFSTPKVGTSFYDPRDGWDSVDPTAGGSFQKTPKAPSRDLSAHADHLLTTPNFALLSPQMPVPQRPSSELQAGSFESLIQTPPPTNSSGQKRKEKNNSAMRSSRADGNRQILPKPASPDRSAASTTSPQEEQFNFDFGSPGLFSGVNFGASTAPVFPQQRLFWDDSAGSLNMDFAAQELFGNARQEGLEPFVSNHGPTNVNQSFMDLSTSMPHTGLPGDPGTLSTSMGGGVDPSLLFSSSAGHAPDAMTHVNADALQPYAYQMQEARREMAYAGVGKNQRKRKPSVDSPAVVAALESLRDGSRPGLRRSATDSFVQRSASGRSSSSSSRAGTSHGRTSPLKQIRSESNKRHRTSVSLVIGQDGRARMEAVISRDEPVQPGMDVESATYSSDSESTEADEDENAGYGALATSFGGDMGPGGMQPSSFYPSSSHSHKSSHSSHYSSTSDPGKSRAKSSKRASRQLILDPVKEGGSFEDDPMVSFRAGPELNSAQEALMQSMKASQRGRYSPQKQSSGLEPFVSSPGTIIDTGYGIPQSTDNNGKKGTSKRG